MVQLYLYKQSPSQNEKLFTDAGNLNPYMIKFAYASNISDIFRKRTN